MHAALYRLSLDAIFVFALVSFVALFFFAAPYGRHGRPGWGVTLREKMGWRIMESPAVAVILLCFLLGGRYDLMSIIFIAIWESHYLYRTFLFTALMREGEKRFPVLIMALAIVFNVLNGYANGFGLFLSGGRYSLSWLLDIRFIAGVALFAAGFAMHAAADSALRGLRAAGKTGYSIPDGGMFRLVSCPNYLGEIVEWSGWALLCWSPAGLAFALFTFANLFPRALSHHRWYRREFPDYPPRRRAIIPFIL